MPESLKHLKTLIPFSSPFVIYYFINTIGSIIPILMVAQLGKHVFAASALAFTSYYTIRIISICTLNSISILISNQIVKRNFIAVGSIVRNGFWICCLITPIVFLIIWNIDQLLWVFDQNPQLIKLTPDYLHYAALVTFPSLLKALIIQFFNGIDKPKISLYLSIIQLPITLVLSYALILGKLGAPQMGLSGVTYALLISMSLVDVIFICLIYFSDYNNKYSIFHFNNLFDFGLCKKILRIGIPSGIESGGEIAAITIFTYFIGWFGTDALAALNVVNQYRIIYAILYMGCSQSIAIVISKAFAQKEFSLIKAYTKSICLFFSLVFAITGPMVVLFSTQLINVFLDKKLFEHQNILILGKYFFLFSVFTWYATSIYNLLAGAFRGMKISFTPMILNVCGLWILSLPLSYVLGISLDLGPVNMLIGFNSGYIFAAIYLWIYFYRFMLHKDHVK